ncbi:putative CRISPR-associated protein [Geminisphaera colitermitum]|uniref:putative CRISPR-associated protein n=1 Tax=Geminisphaera colitermitum TaxID=1148786 RepID=UPI000158D060|nr:putative CRISPR-associated protein [Geminisphaera colitermitum]
MNHLILSTCGTSLLTNEADDYLRKLLTEHANAKTPEELPEAERTRIMEHLGKLKTYVATLSIKDAKKASAELNGILTFYDSQPAAHKTDTHYLLATDTWLGERSAELVKTWLLKNDFSAVTTRRHKDLQTSDWKYFQSALSDLVKWLADEIAPQRNPSTKVIFNLSGGFKSETGFLQALGMFYADETIYLFERSSELMRIPRLPVRMDDEKSVCDDLRDFRRASLGLPVTNNKHGIYWTTLDLEGTPECTFSAWGELVFKQHQNSLYKKELYPSPSDKITFGPNFAESCRHESPDHLKHINQTIDQLAKFAERGDNPRSLDFKSLKGKHPTGATHECDAWADGAAKRIYCKYTSSDKSVIEPLKLGNALH